MFDPDRLYRTTDPELAVIASSGVLAQWRHRGAGPPYVKLSNRILYRGVDIIAWLQKHRVEPTGQAAAA